MNTVNVRKIEIGAGIPKICVPIVGITRNDIIAAAWKIKKTAADIVEWRADWYEDIFDFKKTEETMRELREALGDVPLLFTFRTSQEGGEKEIEKSAYVKLNEMVIKTRLADLVDAEAFIGAQEVKTIVETAHSHGVKVIASNHDFQKTPSKEEIVSRLCFMQESGADIVKIAVMPQNKKDVLTLLSATEEMVRKYARCPVVTMSMSEKGVVSRICGEAFGSALTFGTVGKASAPGQIGVEELRTVLAVLHEESEL